MVLLEGSSSHQNGVPDDQSADWIVAVHLLCYFLSSDRTLCVHAYAPCMFGYLGWV